MSSACETDELLPCPFCGNGAEFKQYKRDGLTLKCQSLGCVSVNQRTLRHSLEWLKGKMIESWNTRATLSNMPAPIAQPVQPPEPAAFTQDELISGDLENNVDKANKAHQANDARALKLQQQFDNIFNR